jgi:hypothetical protein
VEVQEPELARADVAEAVPHADRGRDVVARTGADDLLADDELGLPLEHVEGVDVIRMSVRVDAFEVGAEAKLERLELGELREDAVEALPAGKELALAGAEEDALAHGIASPLTVHE